MTDILLVDDEPGMLETLTDLLEEFGYNVDSAGNGEEALEKIQDKPYDIVFMDVKMPGINGVETFKEIKKIRPGSVVIMMTAYSVEELLEEAVSEGAYGIMYKPVAIPKALEIIETIEKGALILIIDDNPATCEGLIDVLNEKGYRTIVAYDGAESLKLIDERNPDIVFIDMKLPIMNGLDVYKLIKVKRPDIKAIMMTAYQYEVDDLIRQAIDLDAFASLYKPFDVDILMELINGIINGKNK